MGAVDRKSQRRVRQMGRGRQYSSRSSSSYVDCPRLAIFAKIGAKLEVDTHADNGAEAADKVILPMLYDHICQFVPSPLRQSPVPLNCEGPSTRPETSPITGSYRDQLRAHGQRALQLSQETKPAGPPPPPTAPPTLDTLIRCGANPPPPPLMDAIGNADQEQYSALCFTAATAGAQTSWQPAMMMPGMASSWTIPSTNEAPCVMATAPLLPTPLPTPTMFESPMGALIANAMSQAANGEMDGEEIAAQLRAAVPTCYED